MSAEEEARQAALAANAALVDCLHQTADRLAGSPADSHATVLARVRQLSLILAGGIRQLPEGILEALFERLQKTPLIVPVPGGLIRLGFRFGRDLITLAQGGWEPHNLALVRSLVRPGDVALDIGAHVGQFTILMGSLVGSTGRVLAFEPAPENFTELSANVALNGFASVVEPVRSALSDRPGEAEFYSDGDTGGTEFSMFAERHGQSRTAFRVSCSTVDQVLDERGLARVQFMKIDTEGAELLVLRGAEQTLARSPDASLLIELHPWVVSPQKICAHLAERGFALYVFDAGQRLSRVSPTEAPSRIDARGGDILATRRTDL
jgi:FkbM family methyltransferase